ncbi:MAG: DUF4127 family protein [Armatimonadota bacterium]|nr:DUF4127 family protein [Armatimonadota bacterium]MDR7443016.1 DUF4127 family protein [Armatimonadota bacterium]MDR7569380.1 DUF4127 family protein [Armatimonadota bacterium]MDR7614529.1 DUF4127 family protein [Armatimonadota bacterium]
MTVLFVPPDTRPHPLDLPLQLARIAGLDVRTPPAPCLPRLNEPGDLEALHGWLMEGAQEATAAVVSLETLTLGGLIPSRRVETPVEEAVRRLEVLETLRARGVRIYAHATIPRVATGDDPFEERPYYARFGPQLRSYSLWADRAARGDPGAAQRLEEVRHALPPEVLADFLVLRERGRRIHLEALELVRRGVLKRLHLTLDDTAPEGLSVMDRRFLSERVRALGLQDRVRIYPGADEVPCTLLARLLLDEVARRPRVRVISPVADLERIPTRYEDEPLGRLLRGHLEAAGLREAGPGEEADLVVALNAPGRAQGEAAHQPDPGWVDTPERDLGAFVDRIGEAVRAGLPVAVLDVAYANGADDRFVRLLLDRVDPTRLAAYAGWNTAGNTLGSGLGLGVATLLGTNPLPRLEALLVRLAEDWLYQARVRQEADRALEHPDPYDLGPLWPRAQEEVRGRLVPRIEALWREHFAPRLPSVALRLEPPELSWPRLHGVRVRLRIVPGG